MFFDSSYEKTLGSSSMGGYYFAAMLFLRLRYNKSILAFRLLTNLFSAGIMDDIAIVYTLVSDPLHEFAVFLQLKSFKNKLISIKSLMSCRSAFGVPRYLPSAMNMKQNIDDDVPGLFFMSPECRTWTWIVFTNSETDEDLKKCLKKDGVLVSHEGTDSGIRAKATNPADILNISEASDKAGLVIRFAKAKNAKCPLLSGASEEDIEQYIKSFYLYSSQPDQEALENIIKEQMMVACPILTTNDAELIYPFFESKFKDWWGAPQGVMLNEHSTMLEDSIRKVKSLGACTSVSL